MKHLIYPILYLCAAATTVTADIEIRLSVKFIQTAGGNQPGGNVGTTNGFNIELADANSILAATGRGFRLRVVSFVNINPPAPSGQSADYWRTLEARSNRATFEAAALAARGTWSWDDTAINIFINSSSSGQCSFVGGGLSVSLGQNVVPGTMLHELGHYFNLRHTHAGDYPDQPNGPNFVYADLTDGDNLAETARDNPNISMRDQLSQAHFSLNYANLSAGQQATVNSSFDNVMSYHNEDVLLNDQMDLWAKHANNERRFATNGRTWFVANAGNNILSGLEFSAAVQTVSNALGKVNDADDVVLLRSGYYVRPPGGVLATPCTLRATRGAVTIGQ